MVMLTKKTKENYPLFTNWLFNEFPSVQKKKKVWTAFLKWSGLRSREAPIYIHGGSVPWVLVRELGSAQGMFRTKTPNAIYIDIDIVEYFEEEVQFQINAAGAKILAESTILHEMCHWAATIGVIPLKDDNYEVGSVERGKHFENEAYDGDISLSVRPTGKHQQMRLRVVRRRFQQGHTH